MIKKILCFVFAMVMVLSFFGCTHSTEGDNMENISSLVSSESINTTDGSVVNKKEKEYVELDHGNFVECLKGYCAGRSVEKCPWRETANAYVLDEISLPEARIRFVKCTTTSEHTNHSIRINDSEYSMQSGKFYTVYNVEKIAIPRNGHHACCLIIEIPKENKTEEKTEECKNNQHLEAYKYYYQGNKPITKEISVGGGFYMKQNYCGKCLEEIENTKYKFCPHCGSRINWE